jgi:transglutaminase-like putative cysteine protease
MDFRHTSTCKIISVAVLFFFTWTFAGGYDLACAVENAPGGHASDVAKGKSAAKRMSEAVEEVETVLEDAALDAGSKRGMVREKRKEMETLDKELSGKFGATRKKLEDAGLPTGILKRHDDFVRQYEENYGRLLKDLKDIEAAADADVENRAEKALKHIDKVKPQKKHVPLDPEKLPHRAAEPTDRKPRTTEEEFREELKAQVKPILVASAGPLTGLLDADSEYMLLAQATGAPTDADLAETLEVKFTEDIVSKAAELGNDPRAIYEWVRNNIEFVPTHGSIQGADYCLQTMQCNATDTASLLIALLRASNIPARYAHGTVEMPIDKVMNWAGGFTSSTAAIDFMASGGIPTTGLVEGGEIVQARLEHVWVEAWVDYIPSRGARHRVGDTWIPLDASFKQYTYTEGVDISEAVPFDGSGFIAAISSTATYNAEESYVAGLDTALINSTLESYQSETVAFINQTSPSPTLEKVYGGRKINSEEFPYLLGTLPYKLTVVGARYSDLPDSLRHKVTITVSSDDAYNFTDPASVTVSFPEIVGKRLSLTYVSATEEDESVRNNYIEETSFPTYLVNVKPELKADNATLFTGSSISMGTSQELTVDLISPWSTDRATHALRAGDYCVIGLNAGTAGLNFDEEADADLSTVEKIASEILNKLVLGYWMQNDMLFEAYARSFDVNVARYPSEGLATAPIDVEYSFGVPMRGSYSAMALDIQKDRWTITSRDGSADRKVKYNIVTGMLGSVLEGVVFDQLFPEDTELGISSIKLITVALQNEIKVHGIDKTNIDEILPKLQVDSLVSNEVNNAVNAGNVVIMPARTIEYGGWSGEGYIVLDAETGNGAYMLSSGMAGGRKVFSIVSSFPPLEKVSIKGLQDSFEDWLVKQGISFSELIKACPLDLCGDNDVVFDNNLHQDGYQAINLVSILNFIFGAFASEADAAVCTAVLLGAAALITLSFFAAAFSRTGTDIYTDTKSREEELPDWHLYIHYTDCTALPKVIASGYLLPTLWGTYGFGIYMTDNSLLYLFPDQTDTIRQYLEMSMDKPVETYIELKVNENDVWVTHHVNSYGQNEYVARVLYLNLGDPNMVEAIFHPEHCNW